MASSSNSGSSEKYVIALSGFLGRPTDWSLIEALVPVGWTLHAIDVYENTEILNFEEWATKFGERIANELSNELPNQLPNDSRKVLLGYSMGGRLAMHALIRWPDLFQSAMIVSANPGLPDERERELRRTADEIWAGKFLQEPWAELLSEWNAQATLRPAKSVGADAIRVDRDERDFDRVALAKSLRLWSLGVQRNLRDEIGRLSCPIEFVTGEEDVKFTAIARELVKMPAQGPREHAMIRGAGHRVPWETPLLFRAQLAKFLARW